jgi:Domain of unknown function (DUF1707)
MPACPARSLKVSFVANLPDRGGQGHLRVSDAERDQAAEILREATSQGRLTVDELEQRLAQAYAAKTYGELDEVIADLPGPHVREPAAGAGAVFAPDRMGGTPATSLAVAVMSGARRAGQWVVPPTFTAFALMGGVELDLRQARFSEREVTIHAYTIMGGVSIVTGEDVELDVSGFGFMGGFDHAATGPGLPGAPKIKVVGFALMGGVDVRRRPGPDSGGYDRDEQPRQLPG